MKSLSSFLLAFQVGLLTFGTITKSETCDSNSDDSESCTVRNDPREIHPGLDKTKFECPGEAAGFTCDYTSAFSSRDGDHYFCDLDVIQPGELTREEFLLRYQFNKPVVINTTLADWTDVNLWKRDSLLSDYGDFLFDTGRSLELVLNSGIGPTNLTMRDYFTQYMNSSRTSQYPHNYAPFTDTPAPVVTGKTEPLYIFDRSIWKEDDDFQYKYFKSPPELRNDKEHGDYGIFFIGASGTGASFHGHGETWCGVAWGRKRWMFYPPEINPPSGFWPGFGMVSWYDTIYQHLHESVPDTLGMNRLRPIKRHSMLTRRVPRNSDDSSMEGETVESEAESGLKSRRKKKNITYFALNSDSDTAAILASDHYSIEEKSLDDKKSGGESGEMYPENHPLHDGTRMDGFYKPIECMQKEGQLVYLPEFWFHAVINVGDVVAGAIQTSESYSEWMKWLDQISIIEKDLSDSKRKKNHKIPLTDLQKKAKHFEMMNVHHSMLDTAPNNAVHEFFVGYEYLELGITDKAVKHLSRSIRMDPAYIEAYTALARHYKDMGVDQPNKLRKAEQLLRIAYNLNPLHPTVMEMLISIFDKSDRRDLSDMVRIADPLPPLETHRRFNRR